MAAVAQSPVVARRGYQKKTAFFELFQVLSDRYRPRQPEVQPRSQPLS